MGFPNMKLAKRHNKVVCAPFASTTVAQSLDQTAIGITLNNSLPTHLCREKVIFSLLIEQRDAGGACFNLGDVEPNVRVVQ